MHMCVCVCVCVLVVQLCPTLWNPMDCSPPGSSVHGILRAGTLEWVTILSPGDLLNLGIKPRSPALQADSLPVEPQRKPLDRKKKGGGSTLIHNKIYEPLQKIWLRFYMIPQWTFVLWFLSMIIHNRGLTQFYLSSLNIHVGFDFECLLFFLTHQWYSSWNFSFI